MTQEFYLDEIKRYEDCAVVIITRVNIDDDGHRKYTDVSEYETASKGATASARKEIKRLEMEK
jgi:hypothetical protein